MGEVVKRRRSAYAKVLILLVIVAGGVVLVGWLLYTMFWTVITVGSYSLDRIEYAAVIEDAKKQKVNEAQAKDTIKDYFAARSAADELKIDYKNEFSASANQGNQYLQMVQRLNAIESLVAMQGIGARKVGVAYFPFSRYAIGFLATDEAKAMGNDAAKIDNREAILDDMNYARALADEYRAAYLDKSMTAQEIIKKTKSNKRLNYGQAFNTSFYGFVDNNLTIYDPEGKQNTVLQGGVYDTLSRASNPGGVSEVLERVSAYAIPANTPELNRNGQLAVAWYLIFNEGEIKQDIQASQRYTEKKKEYETNAIVR